MYNQKHSCEYPIHFSMTSMGRSEVMMLFITIYQAKSHVVILFPRPISLIWGKGTQQPLAYPRANESNPFGPDRLVLRVFFKPTITQNQKSTGLWHPLLFFTGFKVTLQTLKVHWRVGDQCEDMWVSMPHSCLSGLSQWGFVLQN